MGYKCNVTKCHRKTLGNTTQFLFENLRFCSKTNCFSMKSFPHYSFCATMYKLGSPSLNFFFLGVA